MCAWYSGTPEENIRVLGTGVMSCCGLMYGFWELIGCPLQEQLVMS